VTRDEFDAATTALIRRNWRHMDDLGGQPPAALLDGLWAIVEGHAPEREQLATVLDRIAEHSADADIRQHISQVTASLRGDGLVIVSGPPSVAEAAGKPAPRRTTRRRTT